MQEPTPLLPITAARRGAGGEDAVGDEVDVGAAGGDAEDALDAGAERIGVGVGGEVDEPAGGGVVGVEVGPWRSTPQPPKSVPRESVAVETAVESSVSCSQEMKKTSEPDGVESTQAAGLWPLGSGEEAWEAEIWTVRVLSARS